MNRIIFYMLIAGAAWIGAVQSFVWAFLPDQSIIDFIGSITLFIIGIFCLMTLWKTVYRLAEVTTEYLLERQT